MKKYRELFVLFGLVVMIVIIGTITFVHLEGWTIVDALYYVTAILTTVGAGEVPVTTLGKIISVAYMGLGIAIVVSSLGIIGTTLVKERLKHYFDNQDNE